MEQKKLIDEEQKMNDYKAQKFGQQGELALQQDRLMQPIKDKIFAAIKQIAVENKLAFVNRPPLGRRPATVRKKPS